MSRSSYAAWDKFDVERELERVDEAEKRESQRKQQQKQRQAKESVENAVTQAAQHSAEVLAAHAAVAALKAKNRYKGKENETAAVARDAARASQLQAQAQLFETKHKLLQAILEHRRHGDQCVANAHDGKWTEAKRWYERALEATKALEQVAPALLKSEEELGKNTRQCTSILDKHVDGRLARECGHGEKETKSTNGTTSLPNATDLAAILDMFYQDIYVGLGTCELEHGHLAAATEAFKEVLRRDDEQVVAWMKRGQAFESMGAPLLALLHYNRVMELVKGVVDCLLLLQCSREAAREDGKEAVARMKATLLVDEDALKEKEDTRRQDGWTVDTALEHIQWTFEEAQVLALEGFYAYSTPKFHTVLGLLDAVPTLRDDRERDVLSILHDLTISCHVNIASGCLEMQRHYRNGLTHCDAALALDATCFLAHVRKGQLYRALHQYKQALECFERAARVRATLPTEEHAIEMTNLLQTEKTKCEFDRNQYDLEHIRAHAAGEGTGVAPSLS
ncbi:hypothetical protein PsorP6_006547 [Peronosclerospora sorghi]|uniref:Uncharacterized protein n=1 Tax=Peronosclerospora sorghi TaxID=230839 RepID=A0ACC0W7H7_9STRA|nr:hypothetical protein PsorP6_006547 [Peronosclerospora sorghi]